MIEVFSYQNNNNINELNYIIKLLFSHFLQLEVKINWINDKKTFIRLENGKKIILEDQFFYDFKTSYLSLEKIPKKITIDQNIENQFINEENIPIIYGSNLIEFRDNGNTIYCGIDIFASVFFMVTRWEEFVIASRDEHNRFPATESLAFKHGFLNRPIVNEYIELLWNMMKQLDPGLKRKETKFEIIPTHDVDLINKPSVLRTVAGDLIKRKNLKLAYKRIKNYRLNEYDTFNWLMSQSEKNGVKSRFYFMSGGNSQFDNNFKIELQKKIIKNMQDREHIIGFHPSYNAYNDLNMFMTEKERLENAASQRVIEGRQHYLRFETPKTWQIWDSAEMELDSSMSYADYEGFRCGTAMEFPVFDVLRREELNIIERPLIIMDGTLWIYRNLAIEECYSVIIKYKNICKKYKMPFTILFHNSSFSETEWSGWKKLYSNILNN